MWRWWAHHVIVLQVLGQIARLVFGSCAVGVAFAILLIFFISAADRRPHQEIGATIAMTWLCFWVAEGSGLGGSGILATVTLSLMFTLKGTLKVSLVRVSHWGSVCLGIF